MMNKNMLVACIASIIVSCAPVAQQVQTPTISAAMLNTGSVAVMPTLLNAQSSQYFGLEEKELLESQVLNAFSLNFKGIKHASAHDISIDLSQNNLIVDYFGSMNAAVERNIFNPAVIKKWGTRYGTKFVVFPIINYVGGTVQYVYGVRIVTINTRVQVIIFDSETGYSVANSAAIGTNDGIGTVSKATESAVKAIFSEFKTSIN